MDCLAIFYYLVVGIGNIDKGAKSKVIFINYPVTQLKSVTIPEQKIKNT